MSNAIHCSTPEEEKAALNEFFSALNRDNAERRKAVLDAAGPLKRLCAVMCDRSGQCYKVRALLYSIWNGKPVQLNELLNLDWSIRKDVCAVLLAFGFEDRDVKFFYRELENEIKASDQWLWFLEERFEYKVLEDYAKAHREAAEEERK